MRSIVRGESLVHERFALNSVGEVSLSVLTQLVHRSLARTRQPWPPGPRERASTLLHVHAAAF